MTPTARTQQLFTRLGFVSERVERWLPAVRRRVDFAGVGDLMVFRPGVGIVLLQVTSGSHHAHRRAKALAEPRLRAWLESGGRFEIVSWSKRGPRGQAKTWQVRREAIELTQLPLP